MLFRLHLWLKGYSWSDTNKLDQLCKESGLRLADILRKQ